MPLTQPKGAIRTLASGAYVDAAFSSDGSRLYAVSGNTISVINVATGATITTYAREGCDWRMTGIASDVVE